MSPQAQPSPDLLLVAGPPFSAPLWSGAESRLLALGHAVQSLALHDASSIREAADLLRDHLTNASTPTVLVAHGTAIPPALIAAREGDAAGLVLSNGPLLSPDLILRALARLPTPVLSGVVFRPKLWLRWLASSAGLRRAVINPYVMDRDMVVAVCHQAVVTPERRTATASFLKDNVVHDLSGDLYSGPTLLIWGDHDPLYPAHNIEYFRRYMPHISQSMIPGGQHLHPIERPWAIADTISEWLHQTSP